MSYPCSFFLALSPEMSLESYSLTELRRALDITSDASSLDTMVDNKEV